MSCSLGYITSGNNTLRCRQDGTWTGYPSIPTCKLITCQRPAMANLIVNGSYVVNGTISFRCKDGYALHGNSSAICQPDGLWDSNFPECTEIDCSNPPVIRNGYRVYNSTRYKSNVTYGCDEGYVLKGEEILVCGDNSEWHPNVPNCESIICGLPQSENGDLMSRNNSFSFTSVISLKCRSGYILEGNDRSTCTAQGIWEPEVLYGILLRFSYNGPKILYLFS